MKKTILATALLVLCICLQARAAFVDDDFNRADNNSLGAPWFESGPATSTRILDNQLNVYRTASYTETGYARIRGVEAFENFNVTFKLKVANGFNTNSWIKFCVGVESTGWNQDGWIINPSTSPAGYVTLKRSINGAVSTCNAAFFKVDEWTDITISVVGNAVTITSVSPSRGTMSYSLPAGTLNRNPKNTQFFSIITYHPANSKYDAVIDDLVIAPELLDGDANHDGIVSAGDLAVVQSNFGHVGVPGFLGDANGDGVVSAADYASVQANYGNTASSIMASIPEPCTMALLVTASLALIRHR